MWQENYWIEAAFRVNYFGLLAKVPISVNCKPYERRLINFLNHAGLTPDEFVTLGRKEPSAIEKKLISFIATQKARVGKGEINITISTIYSSHTALIFL